MSRLPDECASRLEVLSTTDAGLLADLKADPGQVSLETLLREVKKLAGVTALQLPPGLFADCSERLVEAGGPGPRGRTRRTWPRRRGRCG